MIKLETFRYEALEVYKVDCGPVKTELWLFNSTDAPPSWIQSGEGLINVDFRMADKPQSLKLLLVAYLEQYPGRNTTSSF